MYDANTNATTVVGSIHEGNTEEEITVTSSLNKMGKRMMVRGETFLAHPLPFLQQAFGQIFKDDVNGFSSISDISFMVLLFRRRSIIRKKKPN
jgi:hypothetical protein